MTSKAKKFYIICAAVTLGVLAIVFVVIHHQRAAVAPVYELAVKGLTASEPNDAQAACRTNFGKFKKISDAHENCCWVWCGNEVVYLVKSAALRIDLKACKDGFTAVTFRDGDGEMQSGYIIDPEHKAKELGRIKLSESEEYTYDSVSMSVRVGLRKGEIDYKDAVYLWEKGSSEVFAVKPDAYELVAGYVVSFTDDGGAAHTCFILDTKI